jgi:hypothetical protein
LSDVHALLSIAVGGPHVFTGDGWDPAPLILAVTLAALLRWSGIPLRGPVLLWALLSGLLLDLVADAFDLSIGTVIAVVAIAIAIVTLRRLPSH